MIGIIYKKIKIKPRSPWKAK